MWIQVLRLQTPMCSAAAPQHLVPTALEAHRRQAAAPLRCEDRGPEPTFHVVSERSVQLRQCVAPGAQLQQPQRHRDAQGGRDQVGGVLRLGERLVETDGEAGVELCHAGPLASPHQPKANEEGRRWQDTHVLRWGRVRREGGPQKIGKLDLGETDRKRNVILGSFYS